MSNTLSERSLKLYQILNGKTAIVDKYRLFDLEPLLDCFFALYDLFCTPESQKRDKHVVSFIKKFGPSIDEIRRLRPSKDDFEIIRTIGKGHFGEVHVVSEKNNNDIYAMKILKKASTLTNDNIAFYEEERDVMAFARSPWITSLEYAFHDPENLYLVMEFLPGGDLLNLLNRYEDSVMEESDARFYLAEIITAVHVVHRLGYVHRDIKPENILIDMTGHLKLADFGSAAKLMGNSKVFCRMPVGTPEYIAPEVLQCMNSDNAFYGMECDWWSVGVVFYETLCGNVPFEGDDILKLYSKIMNHKKSLEFPTDVELSESAKLLICGLLDEQKQRFGYQELAKHEFFKSIDWTTLKDFKPPYIPQLKDSRDTSHFEKFTSSKICSANPITANLANTIPFLGFTFTKSLSEAKDLSTSAKHSISHRCSLSEDPDRKINQFSEQLTQNLEALQQKLREQETQMKSLEFEKSNLSNQLAVKNSTLGVLENQFSSLTAERDKLKCNLECLMTEVSEVTSLKSTIRTLNDELESEKKRLEDVMSECEVIRVKLSKSTSENEQLSSKLKNFDITIKDLQNNISKNSVEYENSLQELKNMIDQSSAQFQDKIKIANEETDKFRKLSRKLETDISFYKENIVKSELNQHEQLSEVKTQIEEYQREVTGLNSKIQTLEELLISKDDQIKNNEVVVLRLNQNIRVLENQVQQNESRSKEFEKQLSDSYEKIKEIRNENEQLETSNQAFKNTTDNYEKKVVELIKSITKLENERKDEKKNASDKISQQQKLIDDNAEAITRMNTEIMNLQNYQFELLSNNGNLNDELNKSKLEIERLHSIIGAQNTSNFSLSQQLEDANVRIRELVSDNEELTNKISSVESYTRVQIFKLESTISQQSKLINFLQADSQKKKGSKLKFKSPDISNTSVLMPPARKDRDLEKLLDIERNNSLKLNSELMRLKEKLKLLDDHKRDTGLLQETLSHVNRDSDTSIANSLVESVSTKEHVLNNLVCFHPNSCFICLRPISYGHTIVQCSNCKIFFHSNCQSGLPCFNCTVVPGLVNIDFLYDFRDLNKLFTSLDSFKPHPPYVGYLSIPNIIAHNKYDWRKHTVEVTETHIYIKNEAEDHVEETGMINFKAMKDPCIVRPAIHTSDVLFTPPVNVPLVFGIEISSTESSHFSFQSNSICHESQSPPTQQNTILFLMAQSLEEKRMWVRLLNELFSVSAINCRFNYPPVCTLNTSEHQVITNVCPVNDEALLIGHSRGISVYDLHENKFTINSEIIEIHSLFRVGMHLFAIVNKNRQLARVESGKKSKPYFSVLAKKKNQIVFSSIKECDNCVDIHFGTMKGDHIYLYVSKPGQLMCLRIPPDGTHCMSLSIETGDIPVSSVAAYEGTVVVCQDKFFFYNFKDRTKKEFLDPTDHSLAFIVYGSSANSNYPMSVFLINKDEIPEFLICCSEFGIIVDKDGRHMSDGPIRWDQIPLSFHYHYKCLIVCCPDKIEIWHIPSSAVYNANESTQPTSFNFKCPSILAQTSSQEKDIYVSEVNHDFSLSIYRVPLRKVVSKRIHSICSQEAPDLGGGGKHVEHSPSHPTPLKYKRSSIMKLLKK